MAKFRIGRCKIKEKKTTQNMKFKKTTKIDNYN